MKEKGSLAIEEEEDEHFCFGFCSVLGRMSRFSRFSKQPQSSSSAVPSNSQKGTQKTQVRDYFDEDDDEDDQIHASKPNLNDGDDDYDPLDAFM